MTQGPQHSTESGDDKLDAYWMRLALDEARLGLGATSPNPPVGAVLVKNGLFIGKGYHHKAGEPHAEINAIRAAEESGADLRGSTIYVTLEPCSTSGRTGPCVEAIQKAGIAKVVVGAIDPNLNHAGNGLGVLQSAGIETEAGVLKLECERLIRFFAKHIQFKQPFVIAKTGMTLDGRITPPQNGDKWITSEESRNDVQRLRSEVDAILVGGETVRQDDPRLTLRNEFAERCRPQPLRVVATQSLQLPAGSILFNDEFSDRTRVFHVEHSDSEPGERQSESTIANSVANVEIHRALDLRDVLHQLGDSGVSSVLLECGGRLMGQAFAQRLVDEIQFYVAPLIGGGERRSVEGADFRCRLSTPQIESIGPDWRVTASVIYDSE